MARVFGYTRPSMSPANPRALAEELAAAGAEIIIVEKTDVGARRGLRERRRVIDQVAAGDTLVLPSLDRLGTTFDDVVRCFELLVDRGVNIRILDVGFETAGPLREAYRDMLKLLAGARTMLTSEAIKRDLAAARAKGGNSSGKPPALTAEQWPDIEARIGEKSLQAVANELGISRQTLWTYRRRMATPDDPAAA